MSQACSALFAPSEFTGWLSEIRREKAARAAPPPDRDAPRDLPARRGAGVAPAPFPARRPSREDLAAARQYPYLDPTKNKPCGRPGRGPAMAAVVGPPR